MLDDKELNSDTLQLLDNQIDTDIEIEPENVFEEYVDKDKEEKEYKDVQEIMSSLEQSDIDEEVFDEIMQEIDKTHISEDDDISFEIDEQDTNQKQDNSDNEVLSRFFGDDNAEINYKAAITNTENKIDVPNLEEHLLLQSRLTGVPFNTLLNGILIENEEMDELPSEPEDEHQIKPLDKEVEDAPDEEILNPQDPTEEDVILEQIDTEFNPIKDQIDILKDTKEGTLLIKEEDRKVIEEDDEDVDAEIYLGKVNSSIQVKDSSPEQPMVEESTDEDLTFEKSMVEEDLEDENMLLALQQSDTNIDDSDLDDSITFEFGGDGALLQEKHQVDKEELPDLDITKPDTITEQSKQNDQIDEADSDEEMQVADINDITLSKKASDSQNGSETYSMKNITIEVDING